MKLTKPLSFATAAFAAASFLDVVDATTLTFLHLNDHHSHFEEVSFDLFDDNIPTSLSVETAAVRFYYGSFARTAALMNQLEQEALADGSTTQVLKLHAGDALTGTVFYTFFGSEMDAVAMNALNLDAFVVGNHEFDDGDSNLATFLEQVAFPVLSYNVKPHEQSALLSVSADKTIKPYMIKELDDGTMLGICGLTVKVTTEQSSFPDEGTTIDDEATAAQACVDELTGQGITHIVMLTHMGYGNDIEWLSSIDGVDVVIGGHSHALLGGDDFEQFGFVPRGEYASLENGKCIVSAWEYMRVVGSLTVDFDDDGNVISCTGAAKAALNPDRYTVRDADPRFDMEAADAAIMTDWITTSGFADSPFIAIEPDETMEAILQPFFNSSNDKRMEVIGAAPENICHTYTEEDPLCEGRLTNQMSGGVCNLVSQGFLFNAPVADFAIQNRGGCRTDILAGDISFGSVFDILPFANTLVLLTMTGDQIKLLLEDALNFFLDPELGGGAGSYPFAAGLRYDMDYTQEFGSRISNVEMNIRLEQDCWSPLDMDATYVVATNSFVAGGRDGYFTFTLPDVAASLEDTYVEYGQSFVNYITDVETVMEPPIDEFSTQSIVTSDGTSFALVGVDDVDPTSCAAAVTPTETPMDSPTTDAPVEAPMDSPTPEAPVESPTTEAPVASPTTEEPVTTEAPTEADASTAFSRSRVGSFLAFGTVAIVVYLM